MIPPLRLFLSEPQLMETRQRFRSREDVERHLATIAR